MEIRKRNNISLTTFPMFEATGLVCHGSSTRKGGISNGVWAELNLGFNRGDKDEWVLENFRLFAQALDISADSLVFCDQVHGTNLRKVGVTDRNKGIGPSDIRETDGLYTNEPGVTLVTFSADCVPLLFLDPVKRVIGAAHAGWRGTAALIGAKMVQTLINEYNCYPPDILAGIGPSIGHCCFEVDTPVAEVFSQVWKPFVTPGKESGKFNIDLWSINKYILLSEGLLPEHIDCTQICTCCHPELFFSHRRDNINRGSMASMICLKQDGGFFAG
jgi:YfiH family protein